MHADYGGVVPELASRDHIRRVLPLTREVLGAAGADLESIDVVAYTRGPGLAGALLVGAGVACSLAAALGKPALGIHHLEGHLLSPFLSADPPAFPFVALLVSGGHTQLLEVRDVGAYTLLGDTIDDAAGEAFDKSAKLLGLGYPGGPALARLAEFGDPEAYALPRPLLPARPRLFVCRSEDGGAAPAPGSRARTASSRAPTWPPRRRRRSSTCWSARRWPQWSAPARAGSSLPAASARTLRCARALRGECAKRRSRVYFRSWRCARTTGR